MILNKTNLNQSELTFQTIVEECEYELRLGYTDEARQIVAMNLAEVESMRFVCLP